MQNQFSIRIDIRYRVQKNIRSNDAPTLSAGLKSRDQSLLVMRFARDATPARRRRNGAVSAIIFT
jgi:hypothetical protein